MIHQKRYLRLVEIKDQLQAPLTWLGNKYMRLNQFYLLGAKNYLSESEENRLCIREQIIGQYLEKYNR